MDLSRMLPSFKSPCRMDLLCRKVSPDAMSSRQRYTFTCAKHASLSGWTHNKLLKLSSQLRFS